jgi:tetratricopeptide (TPR) repeat protein
MNLSQEDRDLKQQIEQAWQLFVTGRWDDALHLCQSVLLIDPDSAMANSVAGACLVRLGHFENAEEYARIGVRLAPGVALAHVFLAEALCANEQYSAAESEYWEAVAVNPSAPAPQIALGRFLLSQDRHQEARTIIEKAILSSPEDADAHYLMAICNSRDQATEEALKAIDLAIKFAPDSSGAWHFRGLVLMSRAKSLKKKQETVAVFRDVAESLRKTVELNSSNTEAREQLRVVYNAIAAIDYYLDSVGELKRSWWQIVLCVVGLVIFAILDRSFWINAIIVVAAVSALALWRNRRRIAGLGPDPFESIHPLELRAATADLRATTNAQLVNEWLN